MSKGNCDCCDRKDVELRRTEVTGIETYACAVCCGGDEDSFDEDCICRMESVHTASIDPPEMIVNRECPVHGHPRDPDAEYERRRDDAADFPDTSVGDEF